VAPPPPPPGGRRSAASAAVGVHCQWHTGIGLPQGPQAVVLPVLMLTLHVTVTRKQKLTRSELETRPARRC
jgi:hypothetical protein